MNARRVKMNNDKKCSENCGYQAKEWCHPKKDKICKDWCHKSDPLDARLAERLKEIYLNAAMADDYNVRRGFNAVADYVRRLVAQHEKTLTLAASLYWCSCCRGSRRHHMGNTGQLICDKCGCERDLPTKSAKS